jgi:hypothetical protein
MKKTIKILLGGVCLALALALGAAEAGKPAPVPADFLKTLKPEHPRLLMSDARLQELKKLAKTDLLLQRYVKDVLKAADRDLVATPLKHEIPDGLRLLATSRSCLDRTVRLGLAWRWTGDRKYADAGIGNLLTVCAFEDWNPRHFLDTAEMSNAVGIGYDWFYAAMDDQARAIVRQGLIKLGMQAPINGRHKTQNNWNMVCNGGLVVGSLAIADTDPDYARLIIPRAVECLPIASKYYAPDGAWNEGPGYWQYATSYMAFAIAALDSAIGNDLGIGATPGFGASGWFPIYTAGPSGHFLCFADAGLGGINKPKDNGRGGMPVLFFLARKYKNPEFSAAEHEVLKNRNAEALHVVWYDPPQPPQPRTLGCLFRGSVPVAVMRSAWNDRNALWVGVKGGFNKVNHGHLDLGNFEMEAQGVRWALDLGSDNYNLPGYFGKQRFDYWRLKSESHNVLLIAGKGQRLEGIAPITECLDGRTVVDLTTAYDDRATQVLRTVTMNKPRTAVQVTDQLDLKAAAEVVWGMTTDAEIAIAPDGSAMLTRNGKQLKATIIEPKGAKLAAEAPPPNPEPYQSKARAEAYKSNDGYCRLVAKIAAPQGKSTITVRLEPVEEALGTRH